MSIPAMPTQLKLLRGNPGKRAIPPEPQPLRPDEIPDPPNFLLDDAKDEWRRLGAGALPSRVGQAYYFCPANSSHHKIIKG
jgi:hypothetical protein